MLLKILPQVIFLGLTDAWLSVALKMGLRPLGYVYIISSALLSLQLKRNPYLWCHTLQTPNKTRWSELLRAPGEGEGRGGVGRQTDRHISSFALGIFLLKRVRKKVPQQQHLTAPFLVWPLWSKRRRMEYAQQHQASGHRNNLRHFGVLF